LQPNSAKNEPDRLFINYAVEDSAFTDWLALKLISEGYQVWYDRLKLLGGESYPQDIIDAIRNQTFRMISILSHNSISKQNPVKERTIGTNITKDRKIDFIIPLNLDGLKSTELDFATTDLTFIPFYKSWYSGFCMLIAKLNEINAPKNQETNRQTLTQWLADENQPLARNEKVWSNLLPVLELPSFLRKFRKVPEVDIRTVDKDWAFASAGRNEFWAFSPPKIAHSDAVEEIDQVKTETIVNGVNGSLTNTLTYLLSYNLARLCIRKGLREASDGSVYFPGNLLQNNKLYFNRYDGRKTFIKVTGERKFYSRFQGNVFSEMSTYYLMPEFRFFIRMLGDPVVRLRIGVHWTDGNGNPIEPKKANSHRKTLCKTWWNKQWLSRVIGIADWISEGKGEIRILEGVAGSFRIGCKPIHFYTKVGIDEEKLGLTEKGEKEEEEDNIALEENPEEDENNEPNSV
jgi:hypothetical protein